MLLVEGTKVGSVFFDMALKNRDFRSNIKKEASFLEGSFVKSFAGIGKAAAIAFTVKAIINFAKESIKLGSDLAEVQNVVEVTFGSSSKIIDNFAKTAVTKFGLAEKASKQYTGTMGAMLKSMGFGTGKAIEMSMAMTGLAGDLASFYNLDTDEAFAKIRSGISGETEPLKQLGINLSAANLEQYALTQGIKQSYSEMSEQNKALLRYNYLMSVTSDAQGDFARTSSGWANQIRVAKLQWDSFKASMGQAFIVILTPILKGLNALLGKLIIVGNAFRDFVYKISGKDVGAIQANANGMADSMDGLTGSTEDASTGVDDLGNATKKAGEKAKKSLASFDELNILSSKIADSTSGIDKGLNLDNTNTEISGGSIVFAKDDVKRNLDDINNDFNIFFTNINTKLKDFAYAWIKPLFIPAPVFGKVANPIWQPNYGLQGAPVFVPSPEFGELPNPIYLPNWNIAESLAIATSKAYNTFTVFSTFLDANVAMLVFSVATAFSVLKQNVITSSQLTYESVAINAQQMYQVVTTNAESMRYQASESIRKMSVAISSSVYGMALNGITSMNTFFSTTHANLSTWATSTNVAIAAWGTGMIQTVANTSSRMATAFVDGLKSMWEKFKEFASATGERIKGSFNGSIKMSMPKGISPAAVGIGALTLLKGALSMPKMNFGAYENGGIINQPTLALMGEKRKKEAVVPLENTSFLDTLANKIASSIGGQSSKNGDTTIIVKIGEDTIVEKVISGINRQSRINGQTTVNV